MKKYVQASCFVYCLASLVICFILLHYISETQHIFENFDMYGMTQIIEDWEKDFVTEVYVVDQEENCYEKDRPLFTQDWLGINGVKYDNLDNYEYNEEHNRIVKQTKIFPMIRQSIFNGKKICGKYMDKDLQDGPGYLGMLTVDKKTMKCKDGYVSCGDDDRFSQKDRLNAACVKDLGPRMRNCPITDIQILRANETLNFQEDDYNQIFEFSSEYKILMSKEPKSLPLVQFRVEESRPCMNQFGQSSSLQNERNDHYQKFDYNYHIRGVPQGWNRDSKQRCDKDLNNNLYFDQRYNLVNKNALNFSNLGDVKEENEVEFIEKNWQERVFYNQSIHEKSKKVNLMFWSRSALKLDDDCDRSKQEVLRTFKEMRETYLAKNSLLPGHSQFLRGTTGLLIIVILSGCLALMCSLLFLYNSHREIPLIIMIIKFPEIIILICCLQHVYYKLPVLQDEQSEFMRHVSYGRCLDQFIRLNEHTIQNSFEHVFQNYNQIKTMFWLMTWLDSSPVLVTICFGYLCIFIRVYIDGGMNRFFKNYKEQYHLFKYCN